MTGGSDCHQNPIKMGKIEIPDFVANQFLKRTSLLLISAKTILLVRMEHIYKFQFFSVDFFNQFQT